MQVEEELSITRELLLEQLPDHAINLWKPESSISDEDFWDLVTQAIGKIENGDVNQLVISREFNCEFESSEQKLLSILKKLIQNTGQYITFLFNTEDFALVWASPERHITIDDNNVTMTPVAGTLKKEDKEDTGQFSERLMKFLNNSKEDWELIMVIEEVLKNFPTICESFTIDLPKIKEVGAVIHSEGDIFGKLKNDMKVLDAFKETLFLSTLVWAPIESAFKHITEVEQESRGYYGATIWIYDKDFLDTAVTIRTAFINKLNDTLAVRAWAWIVADSIPEDEAQETIAKSQWFFGSIREWSTPNKKNYLDNLTYKQTCKVFDRLQERKDLISILYLESQDTMDYKVDKIVWKNFLLVHNWDNFLNLSGYMIERMWWNIDIVQNCDFAKKNVSDYDVVLLGPGYWDINDEEDPKMIDLLSITQDLIDQDKKILWICLGHQAICKTKWFKIERQKEISQWKQLPIEEGESIEMRWHYNSYSPVINSENTDIDIKAFMEDRILDYKENNIFSTQSHPESIMSINWFTQLKDMILTVLK